MKANGGDPGDRLEYGFSQWKLRAMAALEMVEAQMVEITALEELAEELMGAVRELTNAVFSEKSVNAQAPDQVECSDKRIAFARSRSSESIERAHKHVLEAKQACLQLAESAGVDMEQVKNSKNGKGDGASDALAKP